MPTAHTDESTPPGFQGRFVAELIAARSYELAQLAATELISARPEIAARYRPLPREKWTSSFVGRLNDLSAALFAESPRVFGSQVSWARAAFVARGTPLEDLRAGLDVLRRVVAMETTPEDAPLVDSYFVEAIAALDSEAGQTPSGLGTDTPQGKVAAAYLLRILEGDRLEAARVVHDAVRGGLAVRSAYLDVLVPAQQELGRMWHLGEISVAEEHFATSTTQMVMSQLLPMTGLPARDGRCVLTAAVDGNAHDLGVRVVADFFEMAGWRAIYLGASVPIDDLVTAAVDFRTDLVALSAALPTQIPTLEGTIQSLRHSLAERCPRILVGGCAFGDHTRELWRGLGADGFAESADAAVSLANRLVPVANKLV